MDPRTALSVSLVGGIAIACFMRPIRIVRVEGVCSSLYWTVRSWIANYPVTQDYPGIWRTGDPNDRQNYYRQHARLIRVWGFLRPFFASHGYELFVQKDSKDVFSECLPSSVQVATGDSEISFPFAQRLYKDDKHAAFHFIAPRVWAARDRNGRDVIIKAISGPIPDKELLALRRLNTEPRRDDQRNHTIPVLDYVVFNGQVFVVMPRWDSAGEADFATVGEFVRYGKAFLEAIAFLHEHKITHGDITLQNMVMDVLPPGDAPRDHWAGLRGPERRYAMIDFETATMLPQEQNNMTSDTAVDQLTRSNLDKAMKRDVYMLATSVEIHLGCIQDLLPNLIALFDSMKDYENPKQPTASAALSRYEEICHSLPVDVLDNQVQATRWRHGRMTYRRSPPVYYK
ncbi:hypothetical protein BDZ89DRAFT_99587 [Hymenopellis radicata]|nr:hypothetical protein BDZ89DRAFT_99587 [Hymenopellis radicata]